MHSYCSFFCRLLLLKLQMLVKNAASSAYYKFLQLVCKLEVSIKWTWTVLVEDVFNIHFFTVVSNSFMNDVFVFTLMDFAFLKCTFTSRLSWYALLFWSLLMVICNGLIFLTVFFACVCLCSAKLFFNAGVRVTRFVDIVSGILCLSVVTLRRWKPTIEKGLSYVVAVSCIYVSLKRKRIFYEWKPRAKYL